MRAAQEGDTEAYRQLLTEVAGLLRGFVRARRSWLQPHDVEDLVQDVLLSLHAARATYDPRRPFLPWLMAIARNRMADSARRRLRRSENEVEADELSETFPPAGANIGESSLTDAMALRDAIQQLPKGQRAAIEMLKIRQMSLGEASAASGMSVGALKVAIYRAIRRLRRVLTTEG